MDKSHYVLQDRYRVIILTFILHKYIVRIYVRIYTCLEMYARSPPPVLVLDEDSFRTKVKETDVTVMKTSSIWRSMFDV